jgi:hypothetical protein
VKLNYAEKMEMIIKNRNRNLERGRKRYLIKRHWFIQRGSYS